MQIEFYKLNEDPAYLLQYCNKGYSIFNMSSIPSLKNIHIAQYNKIKDNNSNNLLHYLSPFKSVKRSLEYFGINEKTANIAIVYESDQSKIHIKGQVIEFCPDNSYLSNMLSVPFDFSNCMISMAACKNL
eukprot:NODE_33_length_36935_cov_1.609241.p28 type:complete len:130 gc:universal NODE_33_length_36935_cov_1.609241:6463-6074(-)